MVHRSSRLAWGDCNSPRGLPGYAGRRDGVLSRCHRRRPRLAPCASLIAVSDRSYFKPHILIERSGDSEGGWYVKTLIAVVGLSVASIAALGAAPASGAIVGYISDTKCASSGSKAKTAAEWIQPAAFEDCVKKCVKAGPAAVVVTEYSE